MRFDIRFDSVKWTAKRIKLNVKRLHFIPKNWRHDKAQSREGDQIRGFKCAIATFVRLRTARKSDHTFLTDDMQYRKVGFACIARVYMYLHMCISSYDEQEKREDEWKTREKENGKKIPRSTATFNRIFISFSSFALLFH